MYYRLYLTQMLLGYLFNLDDSNVSRLISKLRPLLLEMILTRWSSQGRLNVSGTLFLFGTTEQLEVRELSGSCTQAQVSSYLGTLAQRCDPTRLTVVVLDNAPFHKGKLLQEQRAIWEAQGLYLRYLPAYAPQLNAIESVWRKLKGFLMSRRCYDTLTQLKAALELGLKALNVINI